MFLRKKKQLVSDCMCPWLYVTQVVFTCNPKILTLRSNKNKMLVAGMWYAPAGDVCCDFWFHPVMHLGFMY